MRHKKKDVRQKTVDLVVQPGVSTWRSQRHIAKRSSLSFRGTRNLTQFKEVIRSK